MKYNLEEVIEFIEKCHPNFDNSNNHTDKNFKMFTYPTQIIFADTIEELLEEGIRCYKIYGNRSGFEWFAEQIENDWIDK